MSMIIEFLGSLLLILFMLVAIIMVVAFGIAIILATKNLIDL